MPAATTAPPKKVAKGVPVKKHKSAASSEAAEPSKKHKSAAPAPEPVKVVKRRGTRKEQKTASRRKHRLRRRMQKLLLLARAARNFNTTVPLVPQSVVRGMIAKAIAAYDVPGANGVKSVTSEAREAMVYVVDDIIRSLMDGAQLTSSLTRTERISQPNVAVAARLLGMHGTENMIAVTRSRDVIEAMRAAIKKPTVAAAATEAQ